MKTDNLSKTFYMKLQFMKAERVPITIHYIVTPCSLVSGLKPLQGTRCLQFETRSFEMLVSIIKKARHYYPSPSTSPDIYRF
jgi:hypothetical protein